MNIIILNLTIAWRSLSVYKLRSAFAVLGVFFGTFSLILVSNLSGSFLEQTKRDLDKMGQDFLIVRNGVVKHFAAKAQLLDEAVNLSIDDASAIINGAKSVKQVSPSCTKVAPVKYKGKTFAPVLVIGATPSYQEIRGAALQRGRFITEIDNNNIKKVVVLGARVAEELFADKDTPLGKYILVGNMPCRVIGILEEKGADISGADQDNQVIIPLTTHMKRLVSKNFIDSIYVQVENETLIPLAKTEIEYILRAQHKITPNKKDDFTVLDLKDLKDLKTQTISMITVLGKVSAFASFLIGGIGILSIMILIVNERKTEIGIRRAVGAKKHDIIYQFLIESSIISFSGGIAGLLAGFLLTIIIFNLSILPFYISISGLILSFTASIFIGILSGIYPAKNAIAIHPIDTIRA